MPTIRIEISDDEAQRFCLSLAGRIVAGNMDPQHNHVDRMLVRIYKLLAAAKQSGQNKPAEEMPCKLP